MRICKESVINQLLNTANPGDCLVIELNHIDFYTAELIEKLRPNAILSREALEDSQTVLDIADLFLRSDIDLYVDLGENIDQLKTGDWVEISEGNLFQNGINLCPVHKLDLEYVARLTQKYRSVEQSDFLHLLYYSLLYLQADPTALFPDLSACLAQIKTPNRKLALVFLSNDEIEKNLRRFRGLISKYRPFIVTVNKCYEKLKKKKIPVDLLVLDEPLEIKSKQKPAIIQVTQNENLANSSTQDSLLLSPLSAKSIALLSCLHLDIASIVPLGEELVSYDPKGKNKPRQSPSELQLDENKSLNSSFSPDLSTSEMLTYLRLRDRLCTPQALLLVEKPALSAFSLGFATVAVLILLLCGFGFTPLGVGVLDYLTHGWLSP